MIACYRRIACFVPKNLCRLFSAKIYGSGKPGGRIYSIHINPIINPNVRVLFISEPKFSDRTKVSCAIRVNAGHYDDAPECEGLAHLTEHVIAICAESKRPCDYSCRTCDFHTIFSFSARFDNIGDDFGIWSKRILSTDKLKRLCDAQQILNSHVNFVDSEFHERVPVLQKLTQILSDEHLVANKFGWGNKKSLKKYYDDTQLMDKLEEYRNLFRKRPVFACLVTKTEISKAAQQDIFISLVNVCDEEQNVQSIDYSECSEDNSKRLLIVEADDVEHEWNIFFPYTRPLNEEEKYTMIFYGTIIGTKIEGYLEHYLREIKMATRIQYHLSERGVCIAINLTDPGLKHIQKVSSHVKEYLKFILDNWSTHNNYMYREKQKTDVSTLAYVLDLASKSFYQRFDDNNTHDIQLTEDDERLLITKQILENEHVVHIIRARDPVQVKNVLKGISILNESEKKKDVIYGQTYFICETDGFSKYFELFDFSKYKTDNQRTNRLIQQTKDLDYAAVFDQDGLIFQTYLVTYMNWKSLHLQALYDRDKECLEIKQLQNNVILQWRGVEITRLFRSIDPCSISEEEFNQCKQYLMRLMSRDIIDSPTLAKSLISTAAANHHRTTVKMNPLPNQYRQLQLMDCSDYGTHFSELKEICAEKRKPKTELSGRETCNEKFIINSINENELTTFTSIFCKTIPNKKDAGLIDVEEKLLSALRKMQNQLCIYTLDCSIEKLGVVTGFHIQIVSVENNTEQESANILHKFGRIVEDIILSPAKGAKKPAIFDYQIIVQVKGYKSRNSNPHSFDEAFETWFERHEEDFQRIIRMSSDP